MQKIFIFWLLMFLPMCAFSGSSFIFGSNIYEKSEEDKDEYCEDEIVIEEDEEDDEIEATEEDNDSVRPFRRPPFTSFDEDFRKADYYFMFSTFDFHYISRSYSLWGSFEHNALNEKIYIIKIRLESQDDILAEMEGNESYCKYNFDEPVVIFSFLDDGLEQHGLKIIVDESDKIYCAWKQKLAEDNKDECHLICYVSGDYGKTWARTDRFSKILKISDTFKLRYNDEKEGGIELIINPEDQTSFD